MNPIIDMLINISNKVDTRRSEDEHPLQDKPSDYTVTESVLHDMFTENTGVHMLDSGMYGRHWEQNRAIQDFRKLPYSNVSEYGISKSLFHYLNKRVEFDPEMNQKFLDFANSPKYKSEGWLYCMEEFTEMMAEDDGYLGQGSDNSYNRENCLDQDFQYSWFTHNDTFYCIIQIHGGADIRGGYTDPKVFRCDENLFDYNRLSGQCSCGYADSDNGGYSFYDSDFSEIKGGGFPKEWNFSKRLGKYFCRECKQEVNFG